MYIDDDSLRVSTTEGTEEFRPRRLSWKSPNQFTVAGLGKRQTLNRVSLRFETAEKAELAASALKVAAKVLEEPLLPLVFFMFLFVRVLAVLALNGTSFSPGDFWQLAILMIIGLEAAFILYLTQRRRKRVTAFLRIEGKFVSVKTKRGSDPVLLKTIEWRDATTFVLRGPATKIEVSLSTASEATRVAGKIRSAFPEAKEVQVR
ncbi:hypothetical protein AUG19_08640 [archaeon 13_1_20CM_2_54_9]|nr:MAG: hypothetical protein AUG19_08640 [archaeon 13_1_20CM_2_54_9]